MNMNLFMGIVEGRKDPLALGRVQVRVFGVHTPKNTYPGIPNTMLAWSTVMTPTTSSSMSGIGQTPQIVEGTMVVVMFNDESKQDCIVLGTVPGLNQSFLFKESGKKVPRGDTTVGFQDPEYGKRDYYPFPQYTGGTDKLGDENGKSDLPFGGTEGEVEEGFERTDDEPVQNELFEFQEPEDLRKFHKYPHNQIRQSERGHFEEWDDTYGNERLNRQHRSGTFEEIRPDGTRVQKIINEDYTIISTNQYIHIKGTCPKPRELKDNFQEPYTSDIWNWGEKNESPDTSTYGECPESPDTFGRHIHIEGVDDLFVTKSKRVWVKENTETVVEGNDSVEILGDVGQTILITGSQKVEIGGTQTIDITEDQNTTVGGNQVINISGTQSIDIGGACSISAGGTVTVTSPQVVIDSPTTTCTGNLNVGKALVVGSTIVAGAAITAGGAVTGAGVTDSASGLSMSTHRHAITSGSSAGTTSTGV